MARYGALGSGTTGHLPAADLRLSKLMSLSGEAEVELNSQPALLVGAVMKCLHLRFVWALSRNPRGCSGPGTSARRKVLLPNTEKHLFGEAFWEEAVIEA